MPLLNSNTVTGFQIEPTNICTLKCSGCARTRFINQWPGHWKNHQINVEHLLAFLDIDLNGVSIVFAGNYGDPIYHDRFIELVAAVKQRNAKVQIVTNGSYKTADWWKQLAATLDQSDKVTFSIDGMPDNFTEYRENANWKSIEDGIVACVNAACSTEWVLIPFKFNEACINDVRELSKTLGVDTFTVEPSARFDSVTEALMPSPIYVSGRYNTQTAYKKGINLSSVTPQCANNNQHFISADGYYSPCCFVADHRFYYKTPFGKNKEKYKISHTTLSNLLSDPDVNAFLSAVSDHAVCNYSCGGC